MEESKVNITVDRLITAYNGNKEVEEEKLKNIKTKDHFFIRSGERAVIGTGIKLSKDMLLMSLDSSKVQERGLLLLNSIFINQDDDKEIVITVLNTTKNLIKINRGEVIASGIFLKVE